MPCDDGDLCTYDDLCSNGVCAGTPLSCESDACVSRSCNGSAQCTESYMPAGTSCGTMACTHDYCEGELWNDYPETCALRCDGAGGCEDNCECTPLQVNCLGEGCCTASCQDAIGCFTEAGSCGGLGDLCEANTLTVSSTCVGCGLAGANGVCETTNETFQCDAMTHTQCQSQSCGDQLYYCTFVEGLWAWRTSNACDDGQACTANDQCAAGTCQGQEVVCESDECITRLCDGSASCSETYLGVDVPCGEPGLCPFDTCSGNTYRDFPDSCSAFCDGSGSCDGYCDCTPQDRVCEALGCCEAACDNNGGCFTSPGQCGAPESDSCGAIELVVSSACVGCGLAGAEGSCSAAAMTFECAASSAWTFTTQHCGGDLYYCTELYGQWAWRMDNTCDDGNPCTQGDVVRGGSCEGVVVDGGACNTECISGGSCSNGVCTGGQDLCAQVDTSEQVEQVEQLEEADLESDELESVAEGKGDEAEEVKVCGSCHLASSKPASWSPLLFVLSLLGLGLVLRRARR